MSTRTRKPRGPGRVVEDDKVEILPPGRGLPADWRVLVPTILFGTVTGFAASLVVGGGGLVRHAVVGVLGMLVGQGLVRLTGWRIRTGNGFVDEAAMAVLGAILVVLLARFIA
ncbi:GlsB/YeaQ/YmgE family stress response membrane protein [Bosea caraganae]|uniref:GlsB/YeaQ/YmgE family stress response membrane protein n=1 Tax=Bosea caraganae TaxID=2763117 RepID=UPI001FE8A6E3|nr:GlsB/YeaQ/YmgE family stress response membrane protein [Bosea caraganae]